MGARIYTLEGHSRVVTSVAWSQDGHFLASGGPIRQCVYGTLKPGKLSGRLRGSPRQSSAWRGRRTGTSSLRGKPEHGTAVERSDREAIRTLEGHSESPQRGVVGGKRHGAIGFGAEDKTIRIWDADGMAAGRTSSRVTRGPYYVSPSPLMGGSLRFQVQQELSSPLACDSLRSVAVIPELGVTPVADWGGVPHPHEPVLATVVILNLPVDACCRGSSTSGSLRLNAAA